MGDKYMAVSGLPDHCEDHAKCMARVALDMMDMAKNVKMGSNPVVSKVCNFSYNLSNLEYFIQKFS